MGRKGGGVDTVEGWRGLMKVMRGNIQVSELDLGLRLNRDGMNLFVNFVKQ